MLSEESSNQDMPTHHKKQEYCETRKTYRRGKRKTAVKATGLENDLVKLCTKYGTVEECKTLTSYPVEAFTQTFLVKFQGLQAARFAKRGLDELSFYGSMLHVFYGPEYESVDETRDKLLNRRIAVVSRIKSLQREERKQNMKDPKRKKFPRSVNTGPPVAGYTPSDAVSNYEAAAAFSNLVTTYTATKVFPHIIPTCSQSSPIILSNLQETLHADGQMTRTDKSGLEMIRKEQTNLKLKTPKFIHKMTAFKSAIATSSSGLSQTSCQYKTDIVPFPAPAFIPRIIQMKLPSKPDNNSGHGLLGDLHTVRKHDHNVETEQTYEVDERDYLEHSVKGTAERVRKALKRTIPQALSYQSCKIQKHSIK